MSDVREELSNIQFEYVGAKKQEIEDNFTAIADALQIIVDSIVALNDELSVLQKAVVKLAAGENK